VLFPVITSTQTLTSATVSSITSFSQSRQSTVKSSSLISSTAVTRGSSTLLFGVGPNEDPADGQTVHVEAGDVVIIPAGVSHCSADFEDDYFYLGVYPKASP